MPKAGRLTVWLFRVVDGEITLVTVNVVGVGFGLTMQLSGRLPFRKSSFALFVAGNGPE